MKTKKRLVALILLIFTGLQTVVATEGHETQTRDITGFTAIEVSSGIDLYIKMGNTESVQIEADDDVIDDIKTVVRDGTLHIYTNQLDHLFNWGFNKTQKAYVTVKNLERIDASSGSDVESENILAGDELSVKASSGSDVSMDIQYTTFSLDLSSGSDARISGQVTSFIAEANSGSDIRAEDLETEIAELRASSGSDIRVTVLNELHAKASSGSDIRYYGAPELRDIDASSGADITRR